MQRRPGVPIPSELRARAPVWPRPAGPESATTPIGSPACSGFQVCSTCFNSTAEFSQAATGIPELSVMQITSSRFSGPVAAAPGPEKWLEEAVGRILCPLGRRPFIWAVRYRTARAAYPEISPAEAGYGDRRPSISLFGLAPHGVYHAPSVSGGAVRSYRTLSPLPSADPKAVCSLLHFPSRCRGRGLPGVLPVVESGPSSRDEPQRTPASSSRGEDNTLDGRRRPVNCENDRSSGRPRSP